jgi:prephenate dehydrogenase
VQSMGVIGLGAFGQLLAQRLRPFFAIQACDPSPEAKAFAKKEGIRLGTLKECASARYVVLAVPVLQIGPVAEAIAPYARPGASVFDVASVKLGPTRAMAAALPDHVNIIGTHPLFGPQSALSGLDGLKIAVCPVRGARQRRVDRVLAFLRDQLHLDAFESDPQSHDKDMAMVQGLTHLIAKVLDDMEPLPRRQTTLSFDYLVKAMQLVRGDSEELFRAIERENPYSAEVRARFFRRIDALRTDLEN